MNHDHNHELNALCDEVLLSLIPPGVKAAVGRLHAKGIPRKLCGKLFRQVGATVPIQLMADAEWCRLEAERLSHLPGR